MEQLPDFWRTEIWHPLSVHFPLALLLLATLVSVIALFVKGKQWYFNRNLLLLLGTIGAWVSVFTGTLADGVVARELCDPVMLEQHETFAYGVAWVFSAALLLVATLNTGLLKQFKRYVEIVIVVLMLTGAGLLTYTGHLGAQLVYQQGAGVYQPTEDCGEFE